MNLLNWRKSTKARAFIGIFALCLAVALVFQNCSGKNFQAQIQSSAVDLSSQCLGLPGGCGVNVCEPGKTYSSEDCRLLIPGAERAEMSVRCQMDGLGFIRSSCLLIQCQSGFEKQAEQCVVGAVSNLPLVYEALNVKPEDHVVMMAYSVWFTEPRFPQTVYVPDATFPLAPPYLPSLTSTGIYSRGTSGGYHSADPNVHRVHLRTLKNMGVDAIQMDLSNGMQLGFEKSVAELLDPDGENANQFEAYIRAGVALFRTWDQERSPVKIVTLLGGQCDARISSTGQISTDFFANCPVFHKIGNDGLSPYQRAFEFLYKLYKIYPHLAVKFQGKILVNVFQAPLPEKVLSLEEAEKQFLVGRLSDGKELNSVFTLRQTGGFEAQQGTRESFVYAPLRAVAQKGFWSYIERWNPASGLWPAYTEAPGSENRIESFAAYMSSLAEFPKSHEQESSLKNSGRLCDQGSVKFHSWGYWQNGANSCYPILFETATPRHSGATFREYMRWAKILRPTFLLIGRFNEFTWYSDDGWSEELTNNIESTNTYGSKYELLVAEELQSYRQVLNREKPTPQPRSQFPMKGRFDEVRTQSNGSLVLRGWTCSEGFETSLDVHVYTSGPAGHPEAKFLVGARADQSHESAITEQCQTKSSTKHRFEINIPAIQASQHAGKKSTSTQ